MTSKNYKIVVNKGAECFECIDKQLSHECVRYAGYSRETNSSGNEHLDGFVCYKTSVRRHWVEKHLPGAHIQVMKGKIEQCEWYATLEPKTTLKTFGEHISAKRKGEMEKERWNTYKEECKKGNIDALEGEAYFRYYRTAKEIAKDNMIKPDDLDNVCGHWYYGEAGSYKTTTARTENPGCFIKSRDKWWDGYQDEEVVVLDDIDDSHAWMKGLLKDWGDKWTFKAETKGGVKWIRPKKIIVTSQYHPEQIWVDKETLEAIGRRFKLRLFKKTSPDSVSEGSW
ncbi:MAG: replicase [CRESS virus sp. ctYls24]|nr:MAG: replicase [CRESS virus sp. ctYls24]